MAANRKSFVIGFLLSAKKTQSFLRQELIDACKQRGVIFVPIDKSKLVHDVGQLDAILHKDSSPEWSEALQEYSRQYPKCILIDHPRHISPLRNRLTMLQCIDEPLLSSLHSACPHVTLKLPHQICIETSQDAFQAVKKEKLHFPLLAKPVLADGTPESHHMSLVLNQQGLRKIPPPILLQQFINHGGAIFKVYVVGRTTVSTVRDSLPDFSGDEAAYPGGLLSFSQISNLQKQHHHQHQQQQDLEKEQQQQKDDSVESDEIQQKMRQQPEVDTVKDPLIKDSDVAKQKSVSVDSAFVMTLSELLREKLCLSLFNYDLIRETSSGHFYIIDINYFPGFAKMPNYSNILSEFFAGLAKDSSLSISLPKV